MPKRIAVLKGGWSAERAVSLESGRCCAAALREAGYAVAEIDVGRDLPVLLKALEPAPDTVFNALHGRGGEDGTIQAILNLLRIPYTHSGLVASALAMDKPRARAVFAGAGLPIAEGRVISRAEALSGDPLPRPFVLKPTNEGSSVGVVFVLAGDNRAPETREILGEEVLAERFVPGRELTAAVIGMAGEARALGVLEIKPVSTWYDYHSKYAAGGSEHLYPAPIHPAAYDEICRIAVAAHRALGCRGVSRADFRYDDTAGEPGRPVLLEVNTQPGMTPTSLVPDLARAQGIGFVELVAMLVEAAAWDA